LDAAKLGQTEKIEGFRRLDRLTRAVEDERQPLADFSAAIAHERDVSASLGGRTAFDGERPLRRRRTEPQLSLFSE
jgi:uncharacterized protein